MVLALLLRRRAVGGRRERAVVVVAVVVVVVLVRPLSSSSKHLRRRRCKGPQMSFFVCRRGSFHTIAPNGGGSINKQRGGESEKERKRSVR